MVNIHIINGPNLNLLGLRSPEIYGQQSFADYLQELLTKYTSDELSLHYHQSNHEGQLIDWIHEFGFTSQTGIVINAGGYTHTSIALRDAIDAVKTPCIEVHISNIYAREEFRLTNYLKDVCFDSIVGKGLVGYALGIDRLLGHFSD